MKPLSRVLTLILSVIICTGCALPVFAAEAPEQNGEENGYIVRLKDDACLPMSLMSDSEVDVDPIAYTEGFYTADSLADVQDWIDAGLVEYVVPDCELELLEDPLTTDTRVDEQWYLDMMEADTAWQAGLAGDGVKVAVIDSGVYRSHEDLNYDNITGYSFLGLDKYSNYYDDRTGHGTFVTGVLAAQTNNARGIAGLTDRVDILSLRCFSNSNELYDSDYDSGSASVSVILEAIGYAMTQHVDVINMSFGGPNITLLLPLQEALEEAAEQGILLVAAAGNNGNSTLIYPAAFDCVIGVGMVDSTATVDANSERNASVYVTAPGSGILGLGYKAETPYRTDSGTSMAAPMVSALAVMAKQTDHAIDDEGFRTLLRESVVDKGDAGYDTSYGYGLVNAALLSQALSKNYTITYDCGEGSLPGTDYPTSYTVDRTEPVTLPNNPERVGFTFAGWYDNDGCTGTAITAVPAGTVGDVTYYAGWYDNSETVVSGITVRGCAAHISGEYSFSVSLPAQLSLAELTSADIVVTPEKSGASVSPPETVDGGATWTFTVTGSPGNTKTYTLTAAISANSAPAAVEATKSGGATPVSLDGLTPAVSYSADMSGWFTYSEGAALTYTIVSVSASGADSSAHGQASITGGTLTYAPALADAGKTVTITVKANDGTFDSIDNVSVAVAVESMPGSNSVISPAYASFDQYSASSGYKDIVVTLSRYENTLTAVLNGGNPLTQGTDYTVADNADVSMFETTVTIKKEYLKTQSTGDLTLSFDFSAGNDPDIIIDISNSFVAVTGITGATSEATAGTAKTLSAAVQPAGATNKTIAWSVKSAGGTGAVISSGKLTAAKAGTVTVTATIVNGAGESSNYTQDFTITVTAAEEGGGGGGGGSGGGFEEPVVTEPVVEPPLELLWNNPFHDVPAGSWYYSSVAFVCESGLFTGVSADNFQPENKMNRAMLVTVLHRLAGQPAGSGATFSDVPAGGWYAGAVGWAEEKGIVTGGSAGFDPEGDITREQLVAMLFRYASAAGYIQEADETGLAEFVDSDSVSPWAANAMAWAVKAGIVSGKSGGRLDPQSGASRAEVAAILERFVKKYVTDNESQP